MTSPPRHCHWSLLLCLPVLSPQLLRPLHFVLPQVTCKWPQPSGTALWPGSETHLTEPKPAMASCSSAILHTHVPLGPGDLLSHQGTSNTVSLLIQSYQTLVLSITDPFSILVCAQDKQNRYLLKSAKLVSTHSIQMSS
jgi:hypothetical protein